MVDIHEMQSISQEMFQWVLFVCFSRLFHCDKLQELLDNNKNKQNHN